MIKQAKVDMVFVESSCSLQIDDLFLRHCTRKQMRRLVSLENLQLRCLIKSALINKLVN